MLPYPWHSVKYIFLRSIKMRGRLWINGGRLNGEISPLKAILNLRYNYAHIACGLCLQNLDALHDHLATLYPGMRAPSFRCTETDGNLILHYYSDRPGLEHIVIGIVKVGRIYGNYCGFLAWHDFALCSFSNKAVASKLHCVEVEVEVIRRKGDVIDLVETEGQTTTHALRRGGTGSVNKSNRPSATDQLLKEPSSCTTRTPKKLSSDGN